jgi:RNA polymerase sigma factor (sigma-70 family)
MDKEKVIKEYIGLVNSIVYQYQNSINLEFEDLRQEAITHLWKRLDNYDSSRARITTFITVIIKNHFRNMITSLLNKKDLPIKIDEDTTIGNLWFEDYSKKEKEVLFFGYDIIKAMKYPEKYIVEEILSGRTQQGLSDELGTSRRRVSWIWNNYIKKVKKGEFK